jgi:hypothetical protein
MRPTIAAIRTRLKSFHSFELGSAFRKRLHAYAIVDYQPLHSDQEYLAWIAENLPSFRKCGDQDCNHPYYLEMFSVASQHVHGDTVQQCLDVAMRKSSHVANATP